ncbi:MAG TPA: acyl-CoA thioesterase [Anaerolineae bacterium]|nr:acyl-CoA thioesterase [Anaerolineae bacterium]
MNDYRFYQPIEIRYADIDAQRHVNNATIFSFLENARAIYLQHLGLWDGRNFESIGIILVQTGCTYKRPIAYGQRIHVGVRTTRLGNKSIEMAYSIREIDDGTEFAEASSVIVAYDYQNEESISVPPSWREVIADFEGLD